MSTVTNITEQISELEALKDEIEKLGELQSGKKQELKFKQEEIIESMTDMAESAGLALADLKVTVDNKQYWVGKKQFYSIKVEDRDVGFAALRACGLAHLITEKVDNRSLTKALREAAEENNGELPEAMQEIPLTSYEDAVLNGRATGRKKS